MTLIRWMPALLLTIAVFVYSSGLNGPFLFDDNVHITQNRWVKIDSINLQSLQQAATSSFSHFPHSRPLAQLSFGVNHAFAGLEPWAYKATNLALHLFGGLAVFLFSRLVFRAATRSKTESTSEHYFALTVMAFWLLTPIQVSTVLYTVQRMAQIATLSMLLALSSYLWGRLQMAEGRSGFWWILATVPLSAIGFLGKETAVLVPLLLLTMEMTLLQNVRSINRTGQLHALRFLLIALPLSVGMLYFIFHPELINYDNRPFTLAERLMTESRAMWLYLRMLTIPDIRLFGLFHDDFILSTGLLSPPSTLLSLVGLVTALLIALWQRKKAPFLAFGILFFLAAHALESTFLALEIIFEHRNYLAIVGPLIIFSWLIHVVARRQHVDRLAAMLAALLLISHGAATWFRVNNWSSYENFVLSTAENHPDSARSSFSAAQLMISAVANTTGDREQLEAAAKTFLNNGLKADPRCINCLFGLIVLDLHVGRQPSRELLERTQNALQSGNVGASKISVSQFSYLVRWHQSDGEKLSVEDMHALFEAALINPSWSATGRASIESAYRDYLEFVVNDLEGALRHADAAIAVWGDQWSYHMHKIRVLRKLGRIKDARKALNRAASVAKHPSQNETINEIRSQLEGGQ